MSALTLNAMAETETRGGDSPKPARQSQVGEVTRGQPVATPQPQTSGPRIKVVLGKKRFDAHDVGARYIMRKLVDAGMEVVFTRFALVDELVDAAVQEDADVIALSSLTGGHLIVAGDLMAAAADAGIADRVFVVGGVIADQDHKKLQDLGITGVFGPGTDPQQVVEFLRENVDLEG